jgi:hypothetical protein
MDPKRCQLKKIVLAALPQLEHYQHRRLPFLLVRCKPHEMGRRYFARITTAHQTLGFSGT